MKEKVRIGITDCSKYENYRKWVEQEADVETIKLSQHVNNIDDIKRCHGIILSGGEDVHPRYYNKIEFLELCHEIDEKRDEFEWKVLEYTDKNNVPLLGICRGLQMANIYFGGTLLPHIPAFGKFDHSRTADADRYHSVQVDPNSQLARIVGVAAGEVNSAHHQAADRLGKGLVANAVSPDGVVEAMERENTALPFLQLVQWHPERMRDPGSVFSQSIKRKFLDACRWL